jgi:hypothetical protein
MYGALFFGRAGGSRPAMGPTALLALCLAACATVPAGPSLSALRGSQRTAEQFVADDARCRAQVEARLSARGSTVDNANRQVGASAAAGSAIGAATGAVFDGSSGAAAGAVVGLAIGALAGSGASPATSASVQQQYDAAYFACMYALGHKVPVPSHEVERYRAWFDSLAPGPNGAPAAPAATPAETMR